MAKTGISTNISYRIGTDITLLMQMSESELDAAVPKGIRDRIVAMQAERERFACLESEFQPLTKRLNAYIELARGTHSQDESGFAIPTLNRLGRYVNRDRKSLLNLAKSRRDHRGLCDTLMCLAGICPPPALGQAAYQAREFRLRVADTWLGDAKRDLALLDFLLKVLASPSDFTF